MTDRIPTAGSSAVVALLFCDLVGSTALLTRVGDDANDGIRRSCFADLRAALAEHNGHEVKTLGDGLMASFGSAVDALASAVAMQQRLGRLAATDRSLGLALRVGISVGEATHEQGDWFGTPVVEAARLCAAAAPGQVLATEVVRALVGSRGGHEFEPVGALELKGLAAPVPAVAVGWQPRVAGTPLPPGLETRSPVGFVGRASELKALDDSWTAAAGGVRLALLPGEPGVGKSRLAGELAATVHAAGGLVLFGRCDPELGTSYQPFAEALRTLAGTAPAELLAEVTAAAGPLAGELVRLAPVLAERVRDLPTPLADEPEAERARLFEAVTSALAAVGRGARTLLVLDDLHWAAKPTLLLLQHVLRTPLPGLLVVGTYRDTDLDRTHPLAAVLGELRRDVSVDRIALHGLTASEVGMFVEAAAGAALGFDVTDFAQALFDETEGNPFFVGQVLLHLRDSGAVVHQQGHWQLARELSKVGIPEGVREVVGSRLSRLGDDANHLLQVAAVIGRQFDLAVLSAVADVDPDHVLDHLDDGVRAALVTEVPGTVGRFQFSHALVRDTLYAELTTTRRVRLHDRIAKALDALGAAAWLPQLAYHAAEAAPGGDLDRAVTYGLRAGDLAMTTFAYEEAIEHYARALACVEDEPADTRTIDLLLGLGAARDRAGERDVASATYTRAVDLARSLGEADRFGQAAVGVSGMWFPGGTVDPAMLVLLEEALELLDPEPSALRVRLAVTYARALAWSDDPAELQDASSRALAAARQLGEPGPLSYALATDCIARRGDGDARRYQAKAVEAVDLAMLAGDPTLLMEAHILALSGYLALGDISRAGAELVHVEELAERYRQPSFRWYAESWQASLCILRGELDDGMAAAAAASSTGQQARGSEAMAAYAAQVFNALWFRGTMAELLPAVDAYVEIYPGLPGWQAARGWVRALAGDADGARADVAALAASGLVAIKRDVNFAIGVTCLAETAVALEDRDLARTVYPELTPFGGTQIYVLAWLAGGGIWGDAHLYLGRLALLLGDLDRAVDHLTSAVASNDAVGARLLTALAELQLVHVLRTRSTADDLALAKTIESRAEQRAGTDLPDVLRVVVRPAIAPTG